jgi:hypothetical protein
MTPEDHMMIAVLREKVTAQAILLREKHDHNVSLIRHVSDLRSTIRSMEAAAAARRRAKT